MQIKRNQNFVELKRLFKTSSELKCYIQQQDQNLTFRLKISSEFNIQIGKLYQIKNSKAVPRSLNPFSRIVYNREEGLHLNL